ncbi:hypothetical protein [Ktedonospora formicarum]|uniref:Uncharacterized protein n=1 Tax=Ktedonospora formicarum TaxID=2778364 RepID=A0A8J3I0D2_9CHLR|nr:hypothetical protein [Ktedonospora formicarum]GHO43927.1 hypothetical protein KSX_20900 [Ktedonospora formicarum]
MELLDFTILVLSFIIVVFLGLLLFIRPSRAVLVAALLGGLVMAVINVLVDLVAYLAHFWHYTFTAPKPTQQFPLNIRPQDYYNLITHFPVTFYVSSALVFGALVYLLIWRFEAGPKAWFAKVLLYGVPLFCILRDIYGASTHTAYLTWENTGGIVLTVLFWPVAFFTGYALFKKLAPSYSEVEAQRQEEEEHTNSLKAASSKQ